MNKIKIAFIIDAIYGPGGGTEKQLLLLLNKLSREQFEPHLISLRPSEWMQGQDFSFPVTTFNFGSMISPSFPFELKRLVSFFRQEKFDIAQTFFKDGNIFGTTAAHFGRIPIIISSRRNMGYWHDKTQMGILRFLRRWTDYYLANSHAVVQATIESERAPKEKFHVIYNGMDLDEFKEMPSPKGRELRDEWGVADNELLIGTLANLRPIKDIQSFINVAERLSARHNNLKFVVIGEGPDRPKYEALITSLGLADRIKLVGSRNDIVACLSAMDIAVICSRSEAFSNSLIEYMAAGLPIAATNVGGNPEAITHEQTGLLFESGDAAGFERTLKRLVIEKEFAAKLGSRASESALARFSWEKMIQEHERFYLAITNREN